MDAVALGAIAAVAGSIIVIIFLGFRLKHLMNSTHSED